MAKQVRNNPGNIRGPRSPQKAKRNSNAAKTLRTQGNMKNRVNTFRSESLNVKSKPKLKGGIRKRNVSSPNRSPNFNPKRVSINRQGIANRISNILSTRPSTSNNKVLDARQRLIQKKRAGVQDARDVLTNKARGQDARSKIKGMVADRVVTSSRSNIKIIGSNIVQKVDRNGKISLVTNKNGRNTSDINMAIQKELGLVQSPKPSVKLRRPAPLRKPQNQSARGSVKGPLPLRKTFLNDMEYGPAAESIVYSSDAYKWVKPNHRPASHLISELDSTRQALRDVMREELLLANSRSMYQDLVQPRSTTSRPLRLQPSTYVNLVEEDEEMMEIAAPSRISLQGSTRVSNVHSRLDTGPASPLSHGILTNAKTKVVVPAGHRIVVSNLQNTVTEDDIKELFEDIGHLLSAKLIRSGVAEVIYKNLPDAQKAVDTYHNRQLDGQPMKCLLVNKRPMNQPMTAMAQPMIKTEGIRKAVMSTGPSNRLVPDISTIHKVLFQRK